MNGDWWIDHIDTDDELRVTARMLGNILHDIKGLRTGYVSVNARNAVICGEKKVSDLTNEHFLARQTSGKNLVQFFLENPDCSIDEFLIFLRQICSVHLVLKAENEELKKYQNQGLQWHEEYELAGVQLVKIDFEGNLTQSILREHYHTKSIDLKEIAQLLLIELNN